MEQMWEILEDQALKESIRKRPGMYIGAIGLPGLESMLLQALDSLVQMAKDVSQTELNIEVADNQFNLTFFSKSGLEFNKRKENNHQPYLFLAILNALCEQLGCSIETDGQRRLQIYQAGERQKQVTIKLGESIDKLELAFLPERRLFGETPLSYFILFNRCQELAMLNSGLKITLSDGGIQRNQLYYKQGLVEYIFQKDDSITRGKEPLIIKVAKEDIEIQAVISKNWSASVRDSYVNGHFTSDGGTHLAGFLKGSVDAVNQFLEETNRFTYLTEANFSERFDFVLSVTIKRPKYVGAVKRKIRNPELYKLVKDAVFQEMSSFLKRNPSWYSN